MLIRSILSVGSMTLISRLLGFVRDVALAWTLGAGWMADVFFVAFKLPNLFRRLFAEGAFNLAFVPIFAGKLEQDTDAAARGFARQSLSMLFAVLLVFVLVVEFTMPWVMQALAPGFVDEPEKFALAVELSRITFPYLMFISLVSLFAGILNSTGRFWAAAAAPILLNLCLITAVFGFSGALETPAHVVSWGVAVAGLVQLIWVLFHARRVGWAVSLSWPKWTDDVKHLLKRLGPAALGSGIYQINMLVDTIIASFLISGSISYLFFADRLAQLPLGVVGVAVGTALLPLLSRQVKSGDADEALYSQNRALEFALALTLPAAVALAILPETLVRVLFERGAFTPEATLLTAQAVQVFAVGLPAFVLVKALAPGFYAREDTVTPMKIGALCLIINVVLALALMKPLGHVGLAIATVISQWVNASFMAVILWRRGHVAPDTRLKSRINRLMLASVVMGLVIFALQDALVIVYAGWFGGGSAEGIASLGILVGSGVLVYGFAAHLLGGLQLDELKSSMRKS